MSRRQTRRRPGAIGQNPAPARLVAAVACETMSIATPVSGEKICANCYARLAPAQRFCGQCGQSAQRHAPTLTEFVHEFFSHYVALDGGVLWRSLGALAFRPGKLAVEYFAGRRKRYVGPLRLYLTASILFFVLIKFTGLTFDELTVAEAPVGPSGPVSVEAKPDERGASTVSINFPGTTEPWWSGLEPLRLKLKERIAKVEADAQRDGPKILVPMLRSFVQSLYYAMFILLPLYAMVLKLVYVDKGRTYGEHMVVGLYVHAMVFFTFLALYVLTWPALATAAMLWLMIYPYLSFRRVYGGGGWATFFRGSAVAALYLAISGPVAVVFFLYAVLA